MSTGQNRRKQFIVDKGLQRKMVIGQTWPVALTLLVAATVMCFFIAQVAQEAVEASVQLPSLTKVVAAALAFVVCSTLVIVYCAIRFSNRVAGAIFSTRRSLKDFLAGDHEARVSLRTDDFLVEMVDDVNAVLEMSAKLQGDAHKTAAGEESTTDQKQTESVGSASE